MIKAKNINNLLIPQQFLSKDQCHLHLMLLTSFGKKPSYSSSPSFQGSLLATTEMEPMEKPMRTKQYSQTI